VPGAILGSNTEILQLLAGPPGGGDHAETLLELLASLHRWAEALRPQDAAAALLLAATAAVLVVGPLRGGRPFRRHLPALLLVAVCETWLLVAAGRREAPSDWWPLAVTALMLLVAHIVVGVDLGPAPEGRKRARSGLAYLIVGAAAVLLMLGLRLSSSPGLLLTWEPTVVEGFGASLRAGTSSGAFLGQTLLWDDGLVSRGDHSLLYGAPAYALQRAYGVGVWQLRLVAAMLAVAAVAALFGLARRFGAAVAVASALALGLSMPLLLYGRYGTSLSGSVLGVVLATWACWAFVSRPARQWWLGPLAALALIVATLGYSPGRLVVLVLLAVVGGFGAMAVARGEHRRLVGLGLLALMLAGFWAFEARRGAAGSFLSARGEQIVMFMKQAGYIEQYLGRRAEPESLTAGDRIDLIGRVAARRAPEYVAVLAAACEGRPGFNEIVYRDPPLLPLFIGPMLPFLLLGAAGSLRRLRQPAHLTLVAWLVVTSGTLLLTSRVDAHRMVFLVVPFALWTALGVVRAAAALDDARVGRWPRHAVAATLIGLVVWMDVVLIFPPHLQSSPVAEAMIAEVDALPGDVALASIADPREIGLVNLALLERQQRDPARTGRLLDDPVVRALANREPEPERIRRLMTEVRRETLLMVPAEAFVDTAAALQRAGMDVAELGPVGGRFWRATAAAAPRPPIAGRDTES
jgi:hypothetical protein